MLAILYSCFAGAMNPYKKSENTAPVKYYEIEFPVYFISVH